jgi:D-alanyl-D-alanine carboxypeptidase
MEILPSPRRQGKILLRLALAALLSFGIGVAPVQAAKYASLVIDATSGKVLHSVDPDRQVYPASLTKIMTLYMLFDAIERHKVGMGTQLSVSRHAAGQAPSKLGLEPGDAISVREAILATVVKSANDVAVVIAEALAGSEHEFALAMTAKARQLGMSQTIFRNASGLPHKGQLTTARDMARLALALQRHFPQHYHFFANTEFDFRGETVRTHNKLLRSYDGADGIKTGYIRASGFNLVSSAKRDGRRLIGVVFGGISPTDRNRHMASLLDKGFASLEGRESAPIARVATDNSAADEEATSEGDSEAEPPRKPAKVARTAPREEPESQGMVAGGAHGVQVGAFKLADQAREAARKAQAKLDAGMVHVETVRQKGKTVHRARVMGLTKEQAAKACKLLGKTKSGCIEVRATGIDQIASTDR